MRDEAELRRLVQVFFVLNLLQGYLWGINGTASKYIGDEFGLSESALASFFGIFAFGSLGTLALTRLADRVGRRRLLLLACAATPLSAAASFFAPTAAWYAASQIAVVAILGTLFAVSVVVLTEELPLSWRARGQGLLGLATGLGTAGPLLLVVVAVGALGSWRWLWLPVLPAALLLPLLRHLLPETDRFRIARELGQTQGAGLRELLRSRYRRRALVILGAAFLGNAGNVAALTWAMYRLVEDLALAQATSSGVMAVGGALALAGFPLGGRLCDSWGRRATGAIGSLVATVLGVAYFQIPAGSPALVPLLVLSFGLGGMARTAKMVAWRISATELFPTRLRAAVQGLAAVTAAISAILAQFAIAALTPLLGGLVEGASVVVLLGLPAALVFLFVPETKGVELESAALEEGESTQAFVALGSNLGERAQNLARAVEALAALPGVAVVRTSPVYETAPVGPPQPRYLNAVVELRTTLGPRELLEALLRLEQEGGRRRGAERDQPRELDLDLLFYADSCLDEPGLVVPHPRLHLRAFVLEPLRDLAPRLVHPVLGETVEALAERVRDTAAVRVFAG